MAPFPRYSSEMENSQFMTNQPYFHPPALGDPSKFVVKLNKQTVPASSLLFNENRVIITSDVMSQLQKDDRRHRQTFHDVNRNLQCKNRSASYQRKKTETTHTNLRLTLKQGQSWSSLFNYMYTKWESITPVLCLHRLNRLPVDPSDNRKQLLLRETFLTLLL